MEKDGRKHGGRRLGHTEAAREGALGHGSDRFLFCFSLFKLISF
jgi:hypothetical protein